MKLMIMRKNARWSALDILEQEGIDPQERLNIVITKRLISPKILHEFGCRCAERALLMTEKPDPRSLHVIEVKRMWIQKRASKKDVKEAFDLAMDVVKRRKIDWDFDKSSADAQAMYYAASAATYAASLEDVGYTVSTVVQFAQNVAECYCKKYGRKNSEYERQINELRTMLEAKV